MMALLPYLVAYLGIVVFVVAVIARFIMWSRMPMHMRWELYPVAHEASRAHYGGSYLEELDWWTKKREVSLWGELKVMVPEILFLVALKEHNPKLWTRSFPFHFGLYLLIAWAGLMAIGGILGAVAPAVMEGTLSKLFELAILICGGAGLVLGILGALGLLQRRLGTRELRQYAAPADILNLLLFVVVLGVTFATFVVERGFASFKLFVSNLVTFKMAALPGTGIEVILPTISIILLMLLMAYIPLTHMSHFVGKYFAYHAIRWNDEPNLPGGKQEKIIGELLNRPVSWAAPHIKGDGKKTWADVATADIATEEAE
jgi:nitrate reductase gamma subunit